jgi:hypothetical protein
MKGVPMRLGMLRLPTRILLIFLLLGIALWLLFCTAGFPAWAAPRVQAALSPAGFALEARTMRMDLRGGLVLRGVRLYRRGVIGPPVLEAETLAVHCLPWNILLRDEPVWDVNLKTCRMLPEQLRPGPAVRPSVPAAAGPAGMSGAESSPASYAQRLRRRLMRVRFAVTDAHVWGVRLQQLAGRIDRTPAVLRLRDIAGYVGGPDGKAGAFQAEAARTARDGAWQGSLSTGFDPCLLLDMIDALRLTGLSWALRRFDFESEAPRLEMEYRLAGNTAEVHGRFSGRDMAYNGVGLLRLDGTLTVAASSTNTVVTLDPLLVVRDEGIARGGVALDRRARSATFHGRSALAPRALLGLIGLLKQGEETWWRCEGPADIAAHGRVDLQGRDATAFQADVRARDLTVRGFTTEDVAFAVAVEGRTNRITDVRGRFYGGTLDGNLTLVNAGAQGDPDRYVLSAAMRDADFGRLAAALGAATGSEYAGVLSGELRLGGLTGPEARRSARGAGSVKIVQGHIFRLPLFGGFSRMMSRVIPGLDFLVSQSDARAGFTVSDGQVVMDKVRIEGDVLSLTASGAYALEGTMDFDVQVTLMKEHTLAAKLLRTLTAPLSKLLELRLEGTLAEPTWRSPLLSAGDNRKPPES